MAEHPKRPTVIRCPMCGRAVYRDIDPEHRRPVLICSNKACEWQQAA